MPSLHVFLGNSVCSEQRKHVQSYRTLTMDVQDSTHEGDTDPSASVIINILHPTQSYNSSSNKKVVKFASIPENPSDTTTPENPPSSVLGTRAEIIRRSGHNTFVVGFHGSRGVHEIECTETHVKPELWDVIDNSDYMTFQEGDTPDPIPG